jgi:histidinol-phosphate aminotransferase
MITRRAFAARIGLGAAAVRMSPEMACAQRALVRTGDLPKDMVWLNANENPAGPPAASLAAMREALPTSGRYHYQEFGDIYAAVAKSEDLQPDQTIVGAGSSEVLQLAIDAFTSPTRPLITIAPTFEGPLEVARGLGRPIVLTKLLPDYSADVHKLVEEAGNAHGGLIYICNPNNPTSAITTRKDLEWLVANLPANTILLVDEAYIHFGESPDLVSALPYVRQAKDVIVARTFSKIYGMAGLRVGFAAAKPELIQRMTPLRMGVISIVSARAVVAALADRENILRERRASLFKTRRELCDWLRERKLGFIEPHANFIMIDVGRNAREFVNAMPRLGVAPGRPFPPLDNLLRATIGTDAEMARFRDVFWKVYKG